MTIENDPTQKINIDPPDPGDYSDAGYTASNYEEVDNRSFADKIDDWIAEGTGSYIAMAVVGALLIIIILSALSSQDGGPATESVKACAAIENPEAATACFEAISKD